MSNTQKQDDIIEYRLTAVEQNNRHRKIVGIIKNITEESGNSLYNIDIFVKASYL